MEILSERTYNFTTNNNPRDTMPEWMNKLVTPNEKEEKYDFNNMYVKEAKPHYCCKCGKRLNSNDVMYCSKCI